MQTIRQDIKEKNFRPVYLIYGEEAFLRKSLKNQLKEAISGDDTMNCTCFEGKEVSVSELIGLAETLPFFAENRLLIIENSGLFKREADALADYLPSMPESTQMVFVESEIDKRGRLFKKVKELGHPAEAARQPESALKTWIAGILKASGIRVTESTLNVLLTYTGDDMYMIRTEVEKLISYLGERQVLTAEDIEAVCTPQIVGRIFDMITAMSMKNQKRALELYYDLLALKEPPMRILFLIARQYNQLMQVKELSEQGADQGTIAKKAGLQPFIAGKMKTRARDFTVEELRSNLSACVDMEEAVKTGRMADGLAVELLIVRFSQKNR